MTSRELADIDHAGISEDHPNKELSSVSLAPTTLDSVDSDESWEASEALLLAPCEVCGKRIENQPIADPYQLDVNNRIVMRVLCNACYGQLAMDI